MTSHSHSESRGSLSAGSSAERTKQGENENQLVQGFVVVVVTIVVCSIGNVFFFAQQNFRNTRNLEDFTYHSERFLLFFKGGRMAIFGSM